MNCTARVVKDSITAGGLRLTTLVVTFPQQVFENVVRANEVSYSSHYQFSAGPTLMPSALRAMVVTSGSWTTVIDRWCATESHYMKSLAEALKAALGNSSPDKLNLGEWHLPFVTSADVDYAIAKVISDNDKLAFKLDSLHDRALRLLQMVSVARCMRVIGVIHVDDIVFDDDLALFDHVMEVEHCPPLEFAEHQATPDSIDDGLNWRNTHLHRNMPGWCQYRSLFVHDMWRSRAVECKD